MGYCGWASTDELDRQYHDHEWGIPVHDDRHMFEHLTLECLQCGLSWALMLKKREIFRQCFENFEFDKIAAYDDVDIPTARSHSNLALRPVPDRRRFALFRGLDP